MSAEALSSFHPAVRDWFNQQFSTGATEAQLQTWAAILEGKPTLLAAPTGSGKTLAAFLAVIDRLLKEKLENPGPPACRVIYISPLKALSNDIEVNLRAPLRGIEERLQASGTFVSLEAAVRTGDTAPSERSAMLRRPPDILVTTPESLFNLLTSKGGRNLVGGVHTIIVDEIHAVVQDKRGAHLSLTLERLEHLTGRLQRIGLSATQNPIEETAAFLSGERHKSSCAILDVGHKRQLDVRIALPDSPLSAVMSAESWEELHDQLVRLIQEHRTTLLFVNTRRLAERLSASLERRLGEGKVMAHHGSLSKDKRHLAEQRLKHGELKALVATASLELGLDIGNVDLVCQMGSTRSISAFLQRIGRSRHQVGGTPKGVIFPLTRDELVESVAMLQAQRLGELDRLHIPPQPLDILTQHLIAAAASQDWEVEELYGVFKNAYPYRDLTRERFEELLTMSSEGFTSRRGQRRTLVHYDRIKGELRARRGAQLAVLTSGGSIPDNFEFDVILEPSGQFVGTVNEDFAIDIRPGDVFQLGNTSWRVLRLTGGKLRVEDAQGQPPTVPFWFGEAPGRSRELSRAVGRLRDQVDKMIATSEEIREADAQQVLRPVVDYLIESAGIDEDSAFFLADYLLKSKLALGNLPTGDRLILERFFDEVGDMHLVVHSPFGSRLNRAFGLSLRKKFCRNFNFELQAAANEDAVVLSLGSTHSFPLQEVYGYLKTPSLRDTLVQALFDSPIFEVRWRWNASRALAYLRRRNGEKVPPQFQRMAAEDLIAQVFPDQLACLENIAGDREIPEHPLVDQTIADCLQEAMDYEALFELVGRIERGEIEMLSVELREPSPLSQEILNARPYAFLDPAPLEERRTLAITSSRSLSAEQAAQLAHLAPEAIDTVRSEAFPSVRDADELVDALLLGSYLTEEELQRAAPRLATELVEFLAIERRATKLAHKGKTFWVASERLPLWKSAGVETPTDTWNALPTSLQGETHEPTDAIRELVRGRSEILGPFTTGSITDTCGLPLDLIEFSVLALQAEGFLFQGNYSSKTGPVEWCERGLLHRIHRYSLQELRARIQPVDSNTFQRFLFRWQGLTGEDQPMGPEGLLAVIERMEGVQSPAVGWEADLLPARMKGYDPTWLELLSLSGRVVWGRFQRPSGGATGAVKASPMALLGRERLQQWQRLLATKNQPPIPLSHNTEKVAAYLEERGASFFDALATDLGLLPSQVESALGELVAAGRATSDSIAGLRALLTPAHRKRKQLRASPLPAAVTMGQAGRWSLLPQAPENTDLSEADLEFFAKALLKRYGVVTRKLIDREGWSIPWRVLLRVYRNWEARGEIRGGRFVSGISGEQFALPEAVEALRKCQKAPETPEHVVLAATDPLNLTGLLFGQDGQARKLGLFLLYENGEMVATWSKGELSLLKEGVDESTRWVYQKALQVRKGDPRLRAYLGQYA